jgi:hypothetical protein
MGDEPSFDIAPMTMLRDGLIKSQQKVPPIPATPIAAAAPAASTSAETKQDSFGRAHVPFGEVGAAQYSKLTVGCFDVVMNTKDLIDESVKALNLPADSTRNIRLAGTEGHFLTRGWAFRGTWGGTKLASEELLQQSSVL